MKKKHKAKPLEFEFTKDTFNLEIQKTEDGERTQQEINIAREGKRLMAQMQRAFALPRITRYKRGV